MFLQVIANLELKTEAMKNFLHPLVNCTNLLPWLNICTHSSLNRSSSLSLLILESLCLLDLKSYQKSPCIYAYRLWSSHILPFSLIKLTRLISLNLCTQKIYFSELRLFFYYFFSWTFLISFWSKVDISSWHSMLQYDQDAKLCG